MIRMVVLSASFLVSGTLHADDKMTVTFQVGDREFGGSNNLEIDFWVFDCIDDR